uniref:TIL domain-containing protein n=1 Tax=Plectus sambesii TaxID=2011161 RepID=A0A914X8Y2_9BILA
MTSAIFVLIVVFIAQVNAECPYGAVWNAKENACRLPCGDSLCVPEIEECNVDIFKCVARPLCKGIRCAYGEECVFDMECVIPCGPRGSFAHCQPSIERCVNEQCVPLATK